MIQSIESPYIGGLETSQGKDRIACETNPRSWFHGRCVGLGELGLQSFSIVYLPRNRLGPTSYKWPLLYLTRRRRDRGKHTVMQIHIENDASLNAMV